MGVPGLVTLLAYDMKIQETGETDRDKDGVRDVTRRPLSLPTRQVGTQKETQEAHACGYCTSSRHQGMGLSGTRGQSKMVKALQQEI